ncbi:Zn-dependent M28 family amino/carboxypeptidase [Kineococcus xinjiangensis]|uniref:Zn-dependent M28 family amino/carboxypeptidase n=1 Tax=Kineococcus xinjiangensis TaxID=512762 RepID=A0A2S6IKF9_9ACTN|nr:M28 family metallopeptidase [Kineococcus xinjiangensis]PPK94665.1 Zn-dependent M28 family amino/carboxypeptidase [Kineococcus xinjiangensis]
MSTARPSRRHGAIAATAAAALIAGATPAAMAASPNANNNTSKKLRQAVSAEGIMEHLRALDAIGKANGDTRASGTPGYDKSVDYVVQKLRAAGYSPTVQPFEFPYFADNAPAVLERVSPNPATLGTGTFTFSGSGDVTAAVQAVDINLEGSRASTSGCESTDFAGFKAGNIALIQRGTCAFGDKAVNAEAAGASAVIIFNQGNSPTREDLMIGTLGGPVTKLPVVGASFADGASLAAAGTVARVKTDTVSQMRTTYNVFAETKAGDPNNVVMTGAHLDSVAAGVGINDNGSGSATILEVAEQMAKVKPTNKVRFAWWGAEELGLLGSEHYVANLSEEEQKKIGLYLNFDMVGSPNYVRFVYDGDNSRYGEGQAAIGPEGSGAIEDMFHDYFASVGLASEETPFSGRSDYGPFIEVGIPSGGLFTGAEDVKNAKQAEIFGGEAGVAYDKCYHQACDDISNISVKGLDEMSDAVAHAILTYAFDSRTVNGRGEGRPVSPPGQHVDGTPVNTSGSSEGGGLHDHEHEPEA